MSFRKTLSKTLGHKKNKKNTKGKTPLAVITYNKNEKVKEVLIKKTKKTKEDPFRKIRKVEQLCEEVETKEKIKNDIQNLKEKVKDLETLKKHGINDETIIEMDKVEFQKDEKRRRSGWMILLLTILAFVKKTIFLTSNFVSENYIWIFSSITTSLGMIYWWKLPIQSLMLSNIGYLFLLEKKFLIDLFKKFISDFQNNRKSNKNGTELIHFSFTENFKSKFLEQKKEEEVKFKSYMFIWMLKFTIGALILILAFGIPILAPKFQNMNNNTTIPSHEIIPTIPVPVTVPEVPETVPITFVPTKPPSRWGPMTPKPKVK